MKEIKEDQNKWRDAPFSWVRGCNIVEMSILNLIYRFNAIPKKIPMCYFKYNTLIIKFIWKDKRSRIANTILKNKTGGIISLNLKTYLKAIIVRAVGFSSKESACDADDVGSIPGLGRSPGEGNGNPFWYSCLKNTMDRGAWGSPSGLQRVGHNLATKHHQNIKSLEKNEQTDQQKRKERLEIDPHKYSQLSFAIGMKQLDEERTTFFNKWARIIGYPH